MPPLPGGIAILMPKNGGIIRSGAALSMLMGNDQDLYRTAPARLVAETRASPQAIPARSRNSRFRGINPWFARKTSRLFVYGNFFATV
jgi:hypothetical protein